MLSSTATVSYSLTPHFMSLSFYLYLWPLQAIYPREESSVWKLSATRVRASCSILQQLHWERNKDKVASRLREMEIFCNEM